MAFLNNFLILQVIKTLIALFMHVCVCICVYTCMNMRAHAFEVCRDQIMESTD